MCFKGDGETPTGITIYYLFEDGSYGTNPGADTRLTLTDKLKGGV